jgi:hypothetical protein
MNLRFIDKTRTPRRLKGIALAGVLACTVGAVTPPAYAVGIVNGDFTSYTGTLGSSGGGLNVDTYNTGANLSNWTISNVSSSTGLVFLYLNGPQGSNTANAGVSLNGRFGAFSVFDPGNTTSGTGGAIPNTSPGGGNFIAADGAVGYQVAIYQTLTGLTAGSTYAVSFWYAAGQQSNRTGTTTEGWQVSLTDAAQLTQVAANGTTIQDTPTQAGGGLVQGSFQSWAQATFNFTAASASQVLTFLSYGTPTAQPPVDFLSDVVIQQTPEPATGALLVGALVSIGAFVRVSRKHAGSQNS